MASLSNINGLFDVHSTGAILFSNTHGTSGQILRSNGNAAPTWVAASTVIGGPYLPLTGGTLSGPLSGTSATFSGNVACGNPAGSNTGVRIYYGAGTGDYGSIRFYSNAINTNTIHVFSDTWQSGTIFTKSSGAINIDGNTGVTFGGWNLVDVAFKSGGPNYFRGKVGIGTASPLSILTVGSSTGQSRAAIYGEAYGAAGVFDQGIRGEGSAYGILGISTGAGVGVYGSSSSGYGGYFTSSTGYGLLVANGNVGIGVTGPTKTLQVDGSIGLTTSATDGTKRFHTYPDDYHSWYYKSSVVNSQSADVMTYYQQFLIRHQDSTNVFIIRGNGNVGIGTTAPSQPLDVNGYSICDKQFQRDNTLQTILNTPRVLNIGYRGANGTYTFNPVTLFGSLAQGGQCEIQVTGWQSKVNNGFIYWRDNGSNTNIGNGIVGFVQTAVVGSGAISVSTNSGTNNITIQFTGWHSNAHGWNCKIISYQA
jgi:hypothetical protein